MSDRSTLQMPQNACDCHTHVVGPRSRYPMAEDRRYTPGPASHGALLAHLALHGLRRVVIVQPSVYGTDNRCMLDSLDRLADRARGIAVLDEGVDAATLSSLHRRGIRGLRIDVESAGLRDAEAPQAALTRWAERIERLGWHLQVYAALDIIAALADRLARLAVPVVLDHFAMLPMDIDPDDRRAKALLELLRSGNAYIKLSAPYRLAPSGTPDKQRVGRWASTFMHIAPGRVLWGSDWPHTSREAGKPALEVSRCRILPATDLDESVADWLAAPALKQRVLVDNPACLYRF
ncbi:amidohydrolase family protein [Verminephrobacter eiseniae]|uniref:amidohydrolase family protein n=1 Tax=Verminephrobacter eiseniae TaxID=364317 RepID=UPI002AA2B289|nr:amidohydrolase family protein [Verminephrobacter eiseniae]